MNRGKAWRLALALAVGGGFLWLLMRGVDWRELAAILRTARVELLVLAVSVLALGYCARIRRWQILLSAENPRISLRSCAGPLLAGFAANNVLPFRAGDLLRGVAFSSELGVSAGGAMATLFVERLLDALMLLAALAVALYFFSIDGNQFFALGATALSMVALVLCLALLFPQVLSPVILSVVALARRLSPALGERLAAEAERAVAVLVSSGGGWRLATLMIWSVFAWLAEGAMFYAAAVALGDLATPEMAWLALPVATLSTLLPGTPGYVGSFDFFAAQAMQAGGNTVMASIAYALLVHLVLWLPVTLAGGVWLWLRREA